MRSTIVLATNCSPHNNSVLRVISRFSDCALGKNGKIDNKFYSKDGAARVAKKISEFKLQIPSLEVITCNCHLVQVTILQLIESIC